MPSSIDCELPLDFIGGPALFHSGHFGAFHVTTPENPVSAIEQGLAALGTRFRDAFAAAQTEQALRHEHAKFLGKKGELTAVLALMRHVPAAERPAAGARVNAFKEEVEAAFRSPRRIGTWSASR